MAVAGATMPAVLIQRDVRSKRYHVARAENRPSHILRQDVEEAEAILTSTGTVWIPAYLRGLLAERIGKEIKPLLLYNDKAKT